MEETLIAILTDKKAYIEISQSTFDSMKYGGLDMGSMLSLEPGEEFLLFTVLGGSPRFGIVTFDRKVNSCWRFYNHLEDRYMSISPRQLRKVCFIRRWI